MTASAAIRAALRGYDPSAEQWDVIRAPLEPVAIVAGAGSGKTAVMTARIVHLISEGLVVPAQVLGLTFTNKAAGELEERLTEALHEMDQPHVQHATVLTYNAFAQKIVREHAACIGVDPEAGLMSQAHKWQMLSNLVDDFPPLGALELRHPLSFIPQAINLADQCANHLVTPEDLEEECARMDKGGEDWIALAARKRRDYAQILRLYIAAKRKRRRIDFGDQITFAVQILERFDDVTRELRERWPVVLLDEYQDTNPAQKVMLQRICPPGSAVTAVGDARQAIYGWRGASMFNLINFHLEFPMADGTAARQASLSENFRSGSRIVELANRVISQVPEEHRPGADLVPVKANGEGWVGAAVFTDEGAEAEFIADEITRLHDAEGRSWRDIAILVRAKRFMDAIVNVLSDRDIPVEMPELGGLLRVPAVVDTVAWLRIASDPGPASNRWAARILLGPRYRVHYRDLAPIARRAQRKTAEMQRAAAEATGQREPDPEELAYSLVEALEEAASVEGVSAEALTRIAEFLALLGSLRERVTQPLVEVVQAVVERTGIGDAIAASVSRTAPAMRENLHAFLGVCSEFAPLEGEANLGTFLDYLDMAEESEDAVPVAASAGSDSVKLMTVHGAKGLEFNTVFLPVLAASSEKNKWDGTRKGSVFPDVRTYNPYTSTTQLPPGVRRDAEYLPRYTGNMAAYRRELKQRAEEDERRLFYVAVTRAKQRLYCSAAHWYGADERKGPSEFLSEVLSHGDLVDSARSDEAPDENPIAASMRRELRWPPPQAQLADDVGAWLSRLDSLVAGSASVDDVLSLDGSRELYEDHRRTIERLSAVDRFVAAGSRSPSLSATAAVRIASSKEPAHAVLSPLPERPTDAQRLGLAVHAWIEERNRGLLGLAEEEALDEASLAPDAETVERLKTNFAEMGYADRQAAELDSGEPMTELPFTLKVAAVLVRGRIDAVYPLNGGLEIVDFKTGKVPDEPDWGQLELYAEALAELGYVNGEVTLTYAYLQDAKRVAKTYTPRGVSWLEAGLGA